MLSEKLVKLLNLTTSDNDGEALNAIRAANNLINKNGISWSVILMQDKPPAPRGMDSDGPSIQQMIDQIRAQVTSDFDDTFLNSIEKQYQRRGKLTDNQIRGLQNIYDNWVGE